MTPDSSPVGASQRNVCSRAPNLTFPSIPVRLSDGTMWPTIHDSVSPHVAAAALHSREQWLFPLPWGLLHYCFPMACALMPHCSNLVGLEAAPLCWPLLAWVGPLSAHNAEVRSHWITLHATARIARRTTELVEDWWIRSDVSAKLVGCDEMVYQFQFESCRASNVLYCFIWCLVRRFMYDNNFINRSSITFSEKIY